MKIMKKEDLPGEVLPGRIIQKCTGKDGASKSEKITMGFARYCEDAGPMEPHHHAEEIVYILESVKGWLCYGADRDHLDQKVALEPGMILHIPELEWHVFEYAKNGHVEIIFIYGQTENIRPEEILKSKEQEAK